MKKFALLVLGVFASTGVLFAQEASRLHDSRLDAIEDYATFEKRAKERERQKWKALQDRDAVFLECVFHWQTNHVETKRKIYSGEEEVFYEGRESARLISCIRRVGMKDLKACEQYRTRFNEAQRLYEKYLHDSEISGELTGVVVRGRCVPIL